MKIRNLLLMIVAFILLVFVCFFSSQNIKDPTTSPCTISELFSQAVSLGDYAGEYEDWVESIVSGGPENIDRIHAFWLWQDSGHEGNEDDFLIWFRQETGRNEPQIISIYISKNPDKLFYTIGDSFDPSGGEITVKMTSGEEYNVDMTDEEIIYTGFDSSVQAQLLGVRVSYRGHATNLNIRILVIKEILLQTNPKLVYNVGDELDLTNGRIRVVKSDDSFEILEMTHKDVTVSGFDSSKATDSQVITVRYEQFAITFKVTILDVSDEIKEISILTYPQLVYYVGEEFDTITGWLSVTTNDDEVLTVNFGDGEVFITGFDSSVPCEEQEVTITYRGKSITITVTILEIPQD